MAGDVISVMAQASMQSSWVDAPSMRGVSESDAARLADLLSDQPSQAPSPVQEPGTELSSTQPSGAQSSGNSIGDQILRSMDSAGKKYKASAQEADQLLAGGAGPLQMTDVLRMQFKLIEASFQVDMFSKLVSKGVQHIDQITKLQ